LPPPLGPAIANTKKSTGIAVRRIPGDKGYRSHNPPDRFRVWIDGQVHRVSKAIRREMRRRAAIAPVIGHLKSDHRMDRNYLKGREGDRMNVAAAGDNFRLKALLRALFATLWRVVWTPRLA
jgi:transposase, IS5 family